MNRSEVSRAPAPWGLRHAAEAAAARVERLWRAPLLLALLLTIPAFYVELIDARPPLAAPLAYAVAALAVAAALGQTARRTAQPLQHLRDNPIDALLGAGLLAGALLPPSQGSQAALGLRLGVSALVLLRLVWTTRHLVTRGGLAYLLLLALAVLCLCGAGFWWLEPSVHSLGDGVWLAFTTAATVGYGDIVPTSPAAKIFAVFVVLLGLGVLTTVTAAIAATWVETEERRAQRELLRRLSSQLDSVRTELAALRAETRSAALLQAERREKSKRQPM